MDRFSRVDGLQRKDALIPRRPCWLGRGRYGTRGGETEDGRHETEHGGEGTEGGCTFHTRNFANLKGLSYICWKSNVFADR